MRLDLRLLGLTVVAASVDALSYLGLGHVFPANMTGNTVLLALGLATGDHGASQRSAVALGAYVVAAAVMGRWPSDGTWDRPLTASLVAELALLVAFCAWWLVLGERPSDAPRFGLIALAGASMGLQSSAVGRLGVTAVSTTYITGTWTAFAGGIGERLGRVPRGQRSSDGHALGLHGGIVACYLLAAFVAALVHHLAGAVASVVPVGLLVVVLLSLLARRGALR